MDILKAFVLSGVSYEIKMLWEDNKPLFRASDIAKVLGMPSPPPPAPLLCHVCQPANLREKKLTTLANLPPAPGYRPPASLPFPREKRYKGHMTR